MGKGKPNPGDRIYALSHSTDEAVYLYGYGVYVGDEIVDEVAAGPLAEMARAIDKTNPKLVLDDGTVLWGCECWWGREADFNNMLEGRMVITEDIGVERVKAEPYGDDIKRFIDEGGDADVQRR